MREIECEIKRLEDELDDMLTSSKYFKQRSVTNKRIFEVEKLKVGVTTLLEKEKANSTLLAMFGVLVGFFWSILLQIVTQNLYSFLFSIILFVVVLGAWIYGIIIYRKSIEFNQRVLGLLEMLIIRKKEFKREYQ